jgi:hypothetical protein
MVYDVVTTLYRVVEGVVYDSVTTWVRGWDKVKDNIA